MDDPTATSSPPPIPTVPFIPISDRAAYLARVHYGVTVPLIAFTLIPFSARLYVRVWPVWRVGWDDWLIALGFVSSITDFLLLHYEMFTTPQLLTFTTATHAIKLGYLAAPIWSISMTCIKVSVALTLLARFHPVSDTTRWWRPLLVVLISVQLVYCGGYIVYSLIKCRPLAAAWDFSTPSSVCLTLDTDLVVSSVGSTINIVTDVALSVAPMAAVLWRLRRPRRERVLVCFLTGIGLLASGASVAKAVMVGEWAPNNPNKDSWALAMSIATWTVAEQFIAVFAACSPSLKGPIERLLGRMGILLSKSETIDFVQVVRSRVGRMSVHEIDEKGPRAMEEMGKSKPVRFRAADENESWDSADDDAGTAISGSGRPMPSREGKYYAPM